MKESADQNDNLDGRSPSTRQIYLASTTAEIWHDLVEGAEQEMQLSLEHEVEGYLVMTLIRYQNYAALKTHLLALDYLNAHGVGGQVRQQRLQQLGDISLLFGGLYPEQADRRMVSHDYFIKMGKSAYAAASMGAKQAIAEMFVKLSENFIALTQVLRVVHDYTAEQRPDLLEAWDLWSGMGDRDAWERLSHNGAVVPVTVAGHA